jgi:hypothetical protein
MSQIVRLEILDGLQFPSGFLAQADYTCLLYLRLPASWLGGDALLPEKEELVLENLYGQRWRQGNEDGSRYVVIRMATRTLDDQSVAARVWQQDPRGSSSFQYWYYHVSEDGQFVGTTPEQFNQ